MIEPFVAALLVAFPAALHGAALLGRSILDPIRSPSRTLNGLFNTYPMALSLASGIFAALAFIIGKNSFVAAAFLVIGAFCFLLDMYACLLSLLRYISHKK
jgi:hypothetical protein